LKIKVDQDGEKNKKIEPEPGERQAKRQAKRRGTVTSGSFVATAAIC